MECNFNIQEIFGKPVEEVDHVLKHKYSHMVKHKIPKKDGSLRSIIAPRGRLKALQKALYYKFFYRYRPSEFAHGFVNGRSISTNANAHVRPTSIGKIDIKDFFDTISEEHLKNVLFGNKNICRYCKNYERMLDGRCNPSLYHNKTQKFECACEEMKALYIPGYCEKNGYTSLFKMIINACTYKGHVAQGFPTSPIIANIVMRGFDQAMSEHCQKYGVTYTRYADDLSFSSTTMNKHELRRVIQGKAMRLLWAFGFKANPKKTSWRGRGGRMKVCGVVVNDKMSVQASDVHLFRAKVHHACVKNADETTESDIKKLKGYAAFIMSVDRDKGKKYMDQLSNFERIKFRPAVEELVA